MAEIMTLEHPRWLEFQNRVFEACDFREQIPGMPDSLVWTCNHRADKPLARAILEKMGNIDIEATLKYLGDNGIPCDHEIVFIGLKIIKSGSHIEVFGIS